MDHLRGKAIIASGFHTTRRGDIDILQNALISIGDDGTIVSVLHPNDIAYGEQKDRQKAATKLVTLPEGSYLLPGFVDLHIHAPQYPQLGSALDVPLEVWLQKYTFPLEARYADTAFARKSYRLLVEDLIANGTTTALYFATIHQEATRILADICLEAGQRALIGKVVMDNAEECPDFYRDASPDEAMHGTEDLIGYIRHHPKNAAALVKPVVTPVTALKTSARARPWKAACLSFSRSAIRWPSLATSLMPPGSMAETLPFGPSTRTVAPSALTVYLTPAGRAIGFLPIRDIVRDPLRGLRVPQGI